MIIKKIIMEILLVVIQIRILFSVDMEQALIAFIRYILVMLD